jgi:hypothetical protein
MRRAEMKRAFAGPTDLDTYLCVMRGRSQPQQVE